MTATVILDAGALARLRELDPDGRHGVVPRVMAVFDASLTRALGQLSDQRLRPGGSDPAEVARLAHMLKSSAASVGAMALSRACGDIEERLRAGALSDLGAQVQRLLDEGEAALVAVKAMLQQQAPSA